MHESLALAEQIGELLTTRKETIAIAESSAGGLISAALLAVPGASAYFLGGAVVYPETAPRQLRELPWSATGVAPPGCAGRIPSARAYTHRVSPRGLDRWQQSPVNGPAPLRQPVDRAEPWTPFSALRIESASLLWSI